MKVKAERDDWWVCIATASIIHNHWLASQLLGRMWQAESKRRRWPTQLVLPEPDCAASAAWLRREPNWAKGHYSCSRQPLSNPLIWEVIADHYTVWCHYGNTPLNWFSQHKYMTQGTDLSQPLSLSPSLSFSLSLFFFFYQCPESV